ncbi:MAG: glycosyltransferase family 2 protein [Bacteroidetes bacterium]|nr:glycosyltransferase family 2 protein [Bacteroidota bacterium]
MNNTPLVSVALCTYNGDRYLASLLQSVVKQTYKNIEIIIVDDCSSDNTHRILLRFAQKDDRIKIFRNEFNLGLLGNFAKALSFCKGELIALCDQDDIWDPSKIELQVHAIGDNLINYHDSELIGDNGKPLGKRMSDLFNFYSGDQPEVFLMLNCISGHTMLIKRELLSHALPLQGHFHDWWIAYVAANHGSINYMSRSLVKYRQHDKNCTDVLAKKISFTQESELFKRQYKWLEACANYKENKNPAFVKTLFRLYSQRVNSYFSIGLEKFMKKNAELLFYLSKKEHENDLRRIKRYMWGLKARNFWYGFIKADKRKIVQLY